ncbi:MAG: 5'-methylthioadenosine/S-adenosylhomocysteine nucleosidase family protein [Anaerolineae bacterium]
MGQQVAGDSRRGVAIVTAMRIESLGLAKALEAGPWERRSRRGWREGLFGRCPVVLATCGVGLRSAGRWAQVLLAEYEPRLVILTGAGGGIGPGVEIGDLVLGTCVLRLARRQIAAQHWADPHLLDLARAAAAGARLQPVRGRQPRVVSGGVATSDGVFGDRRWGEELLREHGVAAVEMEGAAIAAACETHGVPFLVVRAVSDMVGQRWQWLSMVRNLVTVQRNAERLVFRLVRCLDENPVDSPDSPIYNGPLS